MADYNPQLHPRGRHGQWVRNPHLTGLRISLPSGHATDAPIPSGPEFAAETHEIPRLVEPNRSAVTARLNARTPVRLPRGTTIHPNPGVLNSYRISTPDGREHHTMGAPAATALALHLDRSQRAPAPQSPGVQRFAGADAINQRFDSDPNVRSSIPREPGLRAKETKPDLRHWPFGPRPIPKVTPTQVTPQSPGTGTLPVDAIMRRAGGLEGGRTIDVGGGVRVGRERAETISAKNGEWFVVRPGGDAPQINSYRTLADAAVAAQSPSVREPQSPGTLPRGPKPKRGDQLSPQQQEDAAVPDMEAALRDYLRQWREGRDPRLPEREPQSPGIDTPSITVELERGIGRYEQAKVRPGDEVSVQLGSGRRRVRVTDVYADVKGGEPGVDGEIVSSEIPGDTKGDTVWAYADQISSVFPGSPQSPGIDRQAFYNGELARVQQRFAGKSDADLENMLRGIRDPISGGDLVNDIAVERRRRAGDTRVPDIPAIPEPQLPAGAAWRDIQDAERDVRETESRFLNATVYGEGDATAAEKAWRAAKQRLEQVRTRAATLVREDAQKSYIAQLAREGK